MKTIPAAPKRDSLGYALGADEVEALAGDGATIAYWLAA